MVGEDLILNVTLRLYLINRIYEQYCEELEYTSIGFIRNGIYANAM